MGVFGTDCGKNHHLNIHFNVHSFVHWTFIKITFFPWVVKISMNILWTFPSSPPSIWSFLQQSESSKKLCFSPEDNMFFMRIHPTICRPISLPRQRSDCTINCCLKVSKDVVIPSEMKWSRGILAPILRWYITSCEDPSTRCARSGWQVLRKP